MKHEFDDIIRGEFITLRKVTVADAPYIYRWRTSKSGQFLNRPANYSLESQINWIESRTDEEANYIIYPTNTHERVGMIGIYEVNWNDLISNCGRLILDAKYVRNSTPYGIEALLLGYGYVFNNMRMRKITGTILGLNTRMIELQLFLGMTREGLLTKHVLINGNYEDLYIMSIFKEEFPAYAEKLNKILQKFRSL